MPLAVDWDALEGALEGEVVPPGAPGYEAARKAAIARFHHLRPEAVVRCATPEDVAETIFFAGQAGLPVAIRSGGHCFAGRSSTTGVVIDVGPMSSVSVSGEVAKVGAGARLEQVYDALDRDGLTIAAGCGPEVGISGLALGGGLGILGRKHGLTSDQLVSAEVVLADGSVIECDSERETDLFWALRGAGAEGFGVVTSLVLRTVPAETGTSFRLVWPSEAAAALIEAWQEWSPSAPDELAASLLVVASGDVGEPPLVHVIGGMLGTEAETAGLLSELAAGAGADPISTSLTHTPYREVKRWLSDLGAQLEEERPGGPPPERAHPYSKSEFFRQPLPAPAIRALLEGLTSGRAAGETRELDFSPWGGAYNRVPADATAFVHREERFLLKQAVVVDSAAPVGERDAGPDWLRGSWAAVHPWGSGGVYPNFPDPELEDPSGAYHGSNNERVAAVKERYNPERSFG